KAINHRQAQSCALAYFLCGKERLKDMRLRLRVHTFARVLNRQGDVVTGLGDATSLGLSDVEVNIARLDDASSSIRHSVARIYHQVHQHLLHLAGIRFHHPELSVRDELQFDMGPDNSAEHLADTADHLIQIEGFSLEHLLAAKGQQLLGELAGSV